MTLSASQRGNISQVFFFLFCFVLFLRRYIARAQLNKGLVLPGHAGWIVRPIGINDSYSGRSGCSIEVLKFLDDKRFKIYNTWDVL